MIASVLRRWTLMALLLLVSAGNVLAQSGRLEGTVTDAITGEPLIGVNIIIEELTIGAATNADGYFTVINIRPGTYTVRAFNSSFTGCDVWMAGNGIVNLGSSATAEIVQLLTTTPA